MKEKHTVSFLISNHFNIFYLTGFIGLAPTEREGFLFITDKSIYFFTDNRYLSKDLNNKLKNIGAILKLIEPGNSLLDHLKNIIKIENILEVEFESSDLTYAEYERIVTTLGSISFKSSQIHIQSIRAIKTTEEVELIREACLQSDKCLREISPLIRVGMTERELAFKMEMWIKEKGFALSFDPIVACDENSAIAHYDTRSGNGVFKKESVILIDFGISYKHYLSDITRMYSIGKPSDEYIYAYETLLRAQLETLNSLKMERDPKVVDKIPRAVLEHSGLPNFAHSTGHGVGLEIHEFPKLSIYAPDILQTGHIVTVEPGVYISGKFGIRIEDTVHISSSSEIDILTQTSKEMAIL